MPKGGGSYVEHSSCPYCGANVPMSVEVCPNCKQTIPSHVQYNEQQRIENEKYLRSQHREHVFYGILIAAIAIIVVIFIVVGLVTKK